MPSELETKLQCHLQALQNVVLHELLRLGPVLEHWGLIRNLTQKYHHALVSHMNELLSEVCSRKACLQLLCWALTQYFSQELLLHPDLQSSELIQHIDLVLLSDWIQQAQDKLLQLVKEEVSSQLDHILTLETQHQPCNTEEQFVSTYVDVIQCIDATASAVEAFSSSLSLKLSHLCLQQLLPFTKSYKQQWFKWLETLQKKKMAEEQMLQFFRTLEICKELKEYLTKIKFRRCAQEVQDISEEVEALLTETETFTQTVILNTVEVFAKNGFKKYFKRNHSCYSPMTDLERLFRLELRLSLKKHKGTIDECYKLIVSLYVKHVSSHKLDKLRKKWSQNVESSVFEDARCIHEIISNLCPGVENWNFPLYFISDLLKTEDINSIKISSGDLLNRHKENGLTVDTSMPFALLQWKGLSRRNIREILTSLLDVEPNLVIPQHRSCIIA
ncbi:exocyst complex component 3 isoform X2 [Periophthalmus magnuspinnatus]|nr:exocyst complex component 3 isoform X2 [Periophthalmus magnuspinnatus]